MLEKKEEAFPPSLDEKEQATPADGKDYLVRLIEWAVGAKEEESGAKEDREKLNVLLKLFSGSRFLHYAKLCRQALGLPESPPIQVLEVIKRFPAVGRFSESPEIKLLSRPVAGSKFRYDGLLNIALAFSLAGTLALLYFVWTASFLSMVCSALVVLCSLIAYCGLSYLNKPLRIRPLSEFAAAGSSLSDRSVPATGLRSNSASLHPMPVAPSHPSRTTSPKL